MVKLFVNGHELTVTASVAFVYDGTLASIPDNLLDRYVKGGPQPIEIGEFWHNKQDQQLVIRTQDNGYLNILPNSLVIRHQRNCYSAVRIE